MKVTVKPRACWSIRARGHLTLNCRSGFTLLEAVVALAIVSVTALSAVETLRAEAGTAMRAKRTVEASVLAERQLCLVDLLAQSEGPLPDSLSSGRFDAPLDAYSWTARIAMVAREPVAESELTVRVEWGQGSYEISTHRLMRPRHSGTR